MHEAVRKREFAWPPLGGAAQKSATVRTDARASLAGARGYSPSQGSSQRKRRLALLRYVSLSTYFTSTGSFLCNDNANECVC